MLWLVDYFSSSVIIIVSFQDYHVALGINAEVRTSDAFNYLKTKYNEMNDPDKMEAFNDTDYSLLKKFMSKFTFFWFRSASASQTIL